MLPVVPGRRMRSGALRDEQERDLPRALVAESFCWPAGEWGVGNFSPQLLEDCLNFQFTSVLSRRRASTPRTGKRVLGSGQGEGGSNSGQTAAARSGKKVPRAVQR